jgi:hypothetical protein
VEEVKKYLSNTSVNAPFFLVVGDGNFVSVRTRLAELGLKTVRLSDFCSAPDKPPSLDKLFGTFDFADIDGSSKDKRIIVLGLGEYLALRGEDEAFKRLDAIKDKKVGNARVVLLLRGVSSAVRKIQQNEKNRSVERYMFFTDNTDSDINVSVVPQNLSLTTSIGVKGLLFELENGKTIASVKTNATFDKSLFTVSKIESAFDGIKHICPTFPLAENLGTTEQWTEFLTSLNAASGEIGALVSEFGDNPEHELVKWISGSSYKNWLYFIALKLSYREISNSYLKYVTRITDKADDLKKNIINAIISVSHKDERFVAFYDERNDFISRLIVGKKVGDSDIAAFVSENRRNINEGLFKLTARSLVERKEFVSLFATLNKQTVTARVSNVYTALSDYLNKYTFTDPKVNAELNALLTDYFDRYKWQKALNAIDEDFLAQVESLANARKYNALRTRSEVITSITNKDNAYLLWIDALGVEFLGFIQKICEAKGLSLRIHIAQADLPTITSVNNGFFYNDWSPKRRKKYDRLDELKHKVAGGYNYEIEKLPVHLAEELDVIESVIETVATELALHHYKKFVIASDHGASRLAVISGQEEKYDNDTKGEHGGRCSKRPADYSPTAYDLPFATESSDGQYLVLANYGRFRGSRKANVEVHGGASLEEVVVPIIEITLANPDTTVELLEKELYASFRKPLTFTLFSKTELQSVRVIIKDKSTPYIAKKTDKNHYVIVTDIKRPGKYESDVFDGDNLAGKITLDVLSETQKKSDSNDFDNLFN